MIDEEDATTNRLLEQFAMHMKDISSVERRCKVTVGVYENSNCKGWASHSKKLGKARAKLTQHNPHQHSSLLHHAKEVEALWPEGLY